MDIIANELIPVYSDNGHQAVNTRDLHEFLEVGKDYSDWFKYRADQNGYICGEDYSPILGKSTGGRPGTDYIVPIDIAKEIAMMENNDKGREVRRYFIEVEKRFRGQVKPMSQAEMLAAQAQLLVDMERRQSMVEQIASQTVERVEKMAEVVVSPLSDNWKDDMNSRINELCLNYGLSYQAFRGELYRRLEEQMRVNLAVRVSRKVERMRQAGYKYAEAKAVTKLDVVADDRGLRAAFETIVRQHQFKYRGTEAAS
jgi:phage anti-repressor protein